VPWLVKFFDHANGIAIVRAYTSSSGWHDLMPRAEAFCFHAQTRFIPSVENRARLSASQERKVQQRSWTWSRMIGMRHRLPSFGAFKLGMYSDAPLATNKRCDADDYFHTRAHRQLRTPAGGFNKPQWSHRQLPLHAGCTRDCSARSFRIASGAKRHCREAGRASVPGTPDG